MSHHLTEQDRCRIKNLLNQGLSPLAIAHKLNRAHSARVNAHFVKENAHSEFPDEAFFAFVRVNAHSPRSKDSK